MKAALALSLAVATASANTIIETNNECWLGQGATLVKKCIDPYYGYCDELEIWAEGRCNVFTFSDSRLTWDSADLKVSYWSYYERSNLESDYEVTGADFDNDDENSACRLLEGSELAESYTKGDRINYTGGMCGFKFLIENSANGPNPIKVLKDGAMTLMAGSALAVAAVLAF